MSRYGKELLIGAIPAVLIFLVYIGVNVIPILFAGTIGTMLFYMIRTRGGVGPGSEKKRPTVKTDLTFDDIGGQDRA